MHVCVQGNRYSTVCVGCPSCTEGCTIKDEGLVPTCTSAYANSASAGVNVTLETLQIDPGYWRATSTSRDILACYHADACLGGVTGASGFCREGYEGPCELIEIFLTSKCFLSGCWCFSPFLKGVRSQLGSASVCSCGQHQQPCLHAVVPTPPTKNLQINSSSRLESDVDVPQESRSPLRSRSNSKQESDVKC